MTHQEKEELVNLLDKYQIKSLFYTEKCLVDGCYHIIRFNDNEDHWVEDKIEGEIEDE